MLAIRKLYPGFCLVRIYSFLAVPNSCFIIRHLFGDEHKSRVSLIIRTSNRYNKMSRRTSAKVASEAAKVLKNPKATKDEKSAAASALSQRSKK